VPRPAALSLGLGIQGLAYLATKGAYDVKTVRLVENQRAIQVKQDGIDCVVEHQ
jgi:hypothetical protein